MKKTVYGIGTAAILCLSLLWPIGVAADETAFYGYRPPVFRPSVVRDEESVRHRQTNLPVRFDLRENDRVSSVKNQHQNGDCWSFATMAAVESHLLPGMRYDFAEKHLVDHVGFENVKRWGGNMQMAQAYLARAAGPVDESEDPYESSGIVDGLEPKVYLKTAYSIANEDIKEALMRYGAVQTAIYAQDGNSQILNPKHSAQYVDDAMYEEVRRRIGREDISNHEVAIVGWDDNYPKENFSVQPSRDGAWIAKNSWGEAWGDQGYYYISYEDRTIGKDNMVYAEVAESKWYDQLYQYDEYGRTWMYGYSSEYNWFANVFTAQRSYERIKAVAFYTNEPGMEYELYVDTDFDGAFNLRRVGGGRMEYTGYHTVEFASEELVTGQRFAVAVKLRTKRKASIAVERNRANYLHRAIANPNESFVSSNGKTWKDLQEIKGWNVCLKAFTVGGESSEPAQEPEELQQASWYGSDYRTNDMMKVWRVRFNQELDPQLPIGQVRVFDAANYREIAVEAVMGSDARTLLVHPQEVYQSGKEYILYVGAVRSISGKELRPIKAKFEVN